MGFQHCVRRSDSKHAKSVLPWIWSSKPFSQPLNLRGLGMVRITSRSHLDSARSTAQTIHSTIGYSEQFWCSHSSTIVVRNINSDHRFKGFPQTLAANHGTIHPRPAVSLLLISIPLQLLSKHRVLYENRSGLQICGPCTVLTMSGLVSHG